MTRRSYVLLFSLQILLLSSVTLTPVCLFVGCLTSQQHASVSQVRICSDNFTCCHTEIEVADPTFHLTQSQYTDTGPTSPSADPRMPGAWQGNHWSANFEVIGMARPRKNTATSGIRTRDLPLSKRTQTHCAVIRLLLSHALNCLRRVLHLRRTWKEEAICCS